MDVIHKIIAQLTAASSQVSTSTLMPVFLILALLAAIGWWATRRKKADRT